MATTGTTNSLKALFLNKTRLSLADLLLLSLHLPLAEIVGMDDSEANADVITSFAANCPRLTWVYAKGCAAVSGVKVLKLSQARKLIIIA